MRLQRVILYQNGIGYFERTGHLAGGKLHLAFTRPELDDVLKTLTVIDRLGASVATVDLPTTPEGARTVGIDVRLAAGKVHDLLVGYAVPTPTWKAAYRVVLDDKAPGALLQGWALVNNSSQEDWHGVQLTLATGAPMSFAQDLHTPEYVRRPDVTGHLVTPTVLGPIGSETVGAADHDSDKILDVDDRCPDEPEIYNGSVDDDGCPDAGHLVVSETHIEILQRITFARDSDQLGADTQAIISATAAVLKNNPDIRRIEIQGHAAVDEGSAWDISSRRALAVKNALVAAGVAANRLEVTPYGATAPLEDASTAVARSKNRRVEFLILERASDDEPAARLTPAAVQASARSRTSPDGVAGSVRYVVGDPISIPHGASTMVAILNTQIRGEDAFLFRPDDNAPGSERHPFRAVRLQNSSGFTLEPGPIAIFARGSFVGDSLIERLQLGETSWIPYAVDGGTTVTVAANDDEKPVKIVAIHKGVISVENAGTHTTRYTIAAGREPARMIYLRHAKHVGYTAKDLPPGTQDQGDAYLIPLPVAAGKTSVLAVEEREPRRATIELLDEGHTELGVYLEGSAVPPAVAARLATAIALRKDMGTIEGELAALRGRVDDVAQRANEVRASIRSLERVRGADDLRKKLVASLAQATADSDAIARQIGAHMESLAAARLRLSDALRDVTLDETTASR